MSFFPLLLLLLILLAAFILNCMMSPVDYMDYIACIIGAAALFLVLLLSYLW